MVLLPLGSLVVCSFCTPESPTLTIYLMKYLLTLVRRWYSEREIGISTEREYVSETKRYLEHSLLIAYDHDEEEFCFGDT